MSQLELLPPVHVPLLEMSELELVSTSSNGHKRKLTTTGVTILGVSGALALGFYAVVTPFLTPALRKVCLPFVPATTTQLKNVRQALKSRNGSLLDIGSGDGRIVLQAAKQGFQATGVEINYWLVLFSRYKAYRHGLQKQASFIKQDLWKTDLSRYENIVVFGVEQMMQPLKEKLQHEMNPGMQVVACRFPFPNWEPSLTIGMGIDTVWVYKSIPQTTDDADIQKTKTFTHV